MSTVNNGLKALACGFGALAITMVLSWSFVESTTAAPSVTLDAPATHMAKLTIQPRHIWFGQSQPAVLVD
ncbi:MAG TPA: hypothetical protein VFB37_10760 [Steroidobacteraceae bacterium]|nr:hypothetical protein [Steroidobacteraceae bacterium]